MIGCKGNVFIAAIVGVGTFVFLGGLQAGGVRSDSKVKVSASTTNPDEDGKQVVTITMIHDKGWHTYANPIENENLTANQTMVSITAKEKPISAKITYPPGILFTDKDTGDKYKIYEDKVNITVDVQRGKGAPGPLEVNVRFCACNASSCLLPATKKIMLP